MGACLDRESTADEEKPIRQPLGTAGEFSPDEVMTAKFDLKCTRDDVKDYQKKLRLEIDKNKELAKKLVRAKKKDRALLLLKMNRFKQKRVDDLDNQLLNLEEMLLNIESSEQQQKVVQGIKAGNMALRELREQMTVEDVEKVMDEAQDHAEWQSEINSLLAGEISAEDESDILAEFAMLEQEEADEVGLELPAAPDSAIATEQPVAAEPKAAAASAAKQPVAVPV